MKRLISVLFFLIFLLTACGTVVPEPQPEPESEPQDTIFQPQSIQRHIDVTGIDIESAFTDTVNYHYDVYDYVDHMVLILVYDLDKENLIDPDADQGIGVTDYCKGFVLYDLSTQSIVKEFPVGQFGACHSAVLAFDGVLYAFASPEDSTISYSDGEKIEKVYIGDFGVFEGPILGRCNGVVLFWDQSAANGSFGVQAIQADLEITPLLTFAANHTKYLRHAFKTSLDYFVYSVQEDENYIFYLGTSSGEPIRFGLHQGDRLFDFDLAKDSLIVSKEGHDGHSGFYLERFDFEGNSIEVWQTKTPLHQLCANEHNQFVGTYQYAPIFAYQMEETIASVAVDFNRVMGSMDYVDSVFFYGDSFLVVGLKYPRDPVLWLLTYDESRY